MSAVLVVAAVAAVRGQEPPPPALALADAPGSWVADVSTTGGYTGRGAGSVSVRSDGASACAAPVRCDANASATRVARLGAAIQAAHGLAWEGQASRTTCNDCIVTTLTIRTRQADGTVTRTIYTWDNVQAPLLPAPVREMYDAAMGVGRR